MKTFSWFRRKTADEELVEPPDATDKEISWLERHKTLVSKVCLSLVVICTLFAVVTLGTDVWNPWNREQVLVETPELYLCAPTPYLSDYNGENKQPTFDDVRNRLRRSQIRRVIRPLSLPPPIGFNFTVDPPLYHDTGARCTWSEFRKKRIPNLDVDTYSFDYQLLDLSNCTDSNDCRRFCFKLYKPNDPNLCNYIILDKSDQKAYFYAIDPLLQWNLTDDPKVDSYSWNCESMPRCDWYWLRRQKLKSIDINDKPDNLIGQVRCRDFGACQRLCESHPSCNYVVMPTNNTKYGPSFLYTVPNEVLQADNYEVQDQVDSFELVCHEGTTPPPVLSPRVVPPLKSKNRNQGQGQAIVVDTSVENSSTIIKIIFTWVIFVIIFMLASVAPQSPDSPNSSSNDTVGQNNTDTSGAVENGKPANQIGSAAEVPPPNQQTTAAQQVSAVIQTSSSVPQETSSAPSGKNIGRRVHGRRKNGGSAKQAENSPQQSQRQKRSSVKNYKQLPLVRRCVSVGTRTDCQEMTRMIVDRNNAQCLKITLDNEETKTGIQVQLYVRKFQDDWTSKGLWLSVRHPSNPYIQEDLFLKPSVRNELEIITKTDSTKNTCKSYSKSNNVTECKEKCAEEISGQFCGCKSFQMGSSKINLCQAESVEKCLDSDEAKEKIRKCSEKCFSECQKYKYTISLKSSADDNAAEENNALLIDVSVDYHGGLQLSSEMIAVFVILILLAFVYIGSFVYCCWSDK